jgi:hypothetical protein
MGLKSKFRKLRICAPVSIGSTILFTGIVIALSATGIIPTAICVVSLSILLIVSSTLAGATSFAIFSSE